MGYNTVILDTITKGRRRNTYTRCFFLQCMRHMQSGGITNKSSPLQQHNRHTRTTTGHFDSLYIQDEILVQEFTARQAATCGLQSLLDTNPFQILLEDYTPALCSAIQLNLGGHRGRRYRLLVEPQGVPHVIWRVE